MLNIAIWETGPVSIKIKLILENDYNREASVIGADNLSVVTFVKTDGSYVDDISQIDNGSLNSLPHYEDAAIINIHSFIENYKKHNISILVIPIDTLNGNNGLLLYLIESGINIQDIYLFDRLKEYNSENVLNSINPYISKDYLPYLEYHVADHCNLNCKGCEHYSSLVTKPVFPDFNEFKSGLTRLKELISDIGTIRLLGGEPLLNPNINDFTRFTRSMYPDSDLYIVTNGALIMKMNEEFYNCVIENNVIIFISQYKPFLNQMEKIRTFLSAKGIKYIISEYIDYFGIRQRKEKSSSMRYFYRCLQARCNFLYGTQIGACYMPFLTKYFNDYFENELEEPLPEDGGINLLNPSLTTELLKIQLLMPFERCRYCTDAKRIDWEVLGLESKLEDWVI